MPMTPLSGVRSSWLMLAMNALFIILAAMASSLDLAMAASARLRSVMSSTMTCITCRPPRA